MSSPSVGEVETPGPARVVVVPVACVLVAREVDEETAVLRVDAVQHVGGVGRGAVAWVEDEVVGDVTVELDAIQHFGREHGGDASDNWVGQWGGATPADAVGVVLCDAGGEEGGPVLLVAVCCGDDQARLVDEGGGDEVEQRVD
eukprot:7389013-Prymnesium_polylepis.4